MKKLVLLTLVFTMLGIGQSSQAQVIESSAEYILSWDVCPTANTATWRQEHYSVWISTTGNSSEDFETMLFEETLLTTHQNWFYETRTVNIDEYANQVVYVAFRHHDITDMDRIVIDNIKLYKSDGSKEDVVFLFEDFQAGIDDPAGEDWLPDGWTVIDLDGDGEKWYFGVRQGEAAMRSMSWDGVPLTPDNWLITPAVLLGTVGIQSPGETVVNVFPNPATSRVNIQSDSPINQVELVNMLGAIVLSEQVNSLFTTIDISNQQHGLYFLRIHTENGIMIRKIHVSR